MTSEAKKRAMKKWAEANRERLYQYRSEWAKDNDEYKDKFKNYMRDYRKNKKPFLDEFKRLSSILL